MSQKLYEARKEQALQKVPAIARNYVNTYFEWLKALQPTDVVDAIEQHKTVEDEYKKAPLTLRMSIALARGFLKASKSMQQKLREIATVNLALATLEYENPQTYVVIQRYGDRGIEYLQEWTCGVLRVLGVS